ncbi:iron uptake protein [Pseudoxanthomonas sp. SGNA-20]|uniref:Iron uptake protein n=1 Tax=Pseudoxanthomonas taiwanensis J19 TaxID=935569 RepID=A0A562E3S1_9GAMM|nr:MULTISPECIES: hypothetical protein [Pseudoxanthomonas]RRN57385.1 iron uptake protein [Pseudoxanthomonas sp. SGNA-20]TWH16569.1 hypothetical protein L613_001200000340 [Pseudoxanthomonas taiwanensis J19]
MSATSIRSRHPRLQLAARVGAGVVGGYVFAWGFIAAGMALMSKAGMEFHDAEFVASALGLLLWLAVLLGVVAGRRNPAWAWLGLLGGGALLAALGSFVQSTMA